MNTQLIEVTPEYVYVTIPAEYICVYHRILAMLADYGEEMLKDCKASCTERNKGVIECYNMFNAAVAARKLHKDKLAETLIKYIKAKINQIYNGADNSTSFVFPIDELGRIKAFISCGELPHFYINHEDGNLYEHVFDSGFDEHFELGPEDSGTPNSQGLVVTIQPRYELIDDNYHACCDINASYNGIPIDLNNAIVEYYFDDIPVDRFNNVINIEPGIHYFKVVVIYEEITSIATESLTFTGQ